MEVFSSVQSYIKLETFTTDNNVFRLHYKATFILLVLCSLFGTFGQYFGDPIDCIVEEISPDVSTNDFFCYFNIEILV